MKMRPPLAMILAWGFSSTSRSLASIAKYFEIHATFRSWKAAAWPGSKSTISMDFAPSRRS